jgi:hypothetical protein
MRKRFTSLHLSRFRAYHCLLGSYHFINIYSPSVQRLEDIANAFAMRSSYFFQVSKGCFSLMRGRFSV